METPSEIPNRHHFRGENGSPAVVHWQPRKKSKFTLKTEPCRLSARKSVYKRRQQREPRQRLKISEMIGAMFSCFRKSR